MSDAPPKIRIGGFDKLDARAFEQQVPDGVSFEQEELTSDKAGEPATLIAVVSITALGIKALAHWLMKQRTRGQLEYRVEIEYPDGTRQTETLRLDTLSSTPASAEVVQALGESLQLDSQLLTDALQAAAD